MYMLLVEIEAVFRNFKRDLGIRAVSPIGSPGRRPHLCLFPGVLLSRDVATLAPQVGAGSHPETGIGSVRHRPNDRFGISDHRWTPTGPESVHATGGRRETIAGGPWDELSRATATANSRQQAGLSASAEIDFVVQTWNQEDPVFPMNAQFLPKNRLQCRKLG